MNLWVIAGYVLAAGTLILLAISSVQSLFQAALLARCRTASLAGLAGKSAAVCGPVKVRQVLRIAHLGDVLWHREIVKATRGQTVTIDSDVSDRADFSIVVGGEEVRVADNPTEVQGPGRRSTKDGSGAFAVSRQTVIDEWLPIVDELTVVGRLRRTDAGWEIVGDAKSGLLFSRNDPQRAAFLESLKGWLGIAGTVAGFVALWFLYFKLST
ncbi:MAG TPA: hypothetical protein VJU16_07215 [Planctomycetota bacterium]|nr:hypothetical protein [Planctomycetota bacterium]